MDGAGVSMVSGARASGTSLLFFGPWAMPAASSTALALLKQALGGQHEQVGVPVDVSGLSPAHGMTVLLFVPLFIAFHSFCVPLKPMIRDL